MDAGQIGMILTISVFIVLQQQLDDFGPEPQAEEECAVAFLGTQSSCIGQRKITERFFWLKVGIYFKS